MLKTQSSPGHKKVNITEATSRNEGVEEIWWCLHCHYYQYNCCSSVADVDEQQQQQQHCIDVHILPAYLNALDILRLVERQQLLPLQYCLIGYDSHILHVTAAALIVAPHPRKRRRTA